MTKAPKPPGGNGCASIKKLAAMLLAVCASMAMLRYFSLRTGSLPKRSRLRVSGVVEFEVCNGLSNQILSVYYGLLLANASSRAALLPNVILDGAQSSGANILSRRGQRDSQNQLGLFFSEPHMARVLYKHKIAVGRPPFPFPDDPIDVSDNQNLVHPMSSSTHARHLKIGCPLFKVPSAMVSGYRDLFFDIITLPPSHYIKSLVRKELAYLPSVFNFLHLRVENDWERHCKKWRGDSAGHCKGDVENLPWYLRNHTSIQPGTPLLLALDRAAVSEATLESLVAKFHSAGYQVHVSSLGRNYPREIRAAVQMQFGLEAKIFMGNSVSTFTALIILARQHLNRPSGYYNQEGIPAEIFLPFFQVPWVFTLTGSSPESFLDMARRAVLSLQNTDGTVKPYCVYVGNAREPMYEWLELHGVTVIQYSPHWTNRLWAQLHQTSPASNQPERISSTKSEVTDKFLVIDLPLLEELKHHTYVLYAPATLYFRRRLLLRQFRVYPSTVAMAPSVAGNGLGHSGAILVNLPALRNTYKDFLATVLSTSGTMNSTGPWSQYSNFYSDSKQVLPAEFDASAYKEFDGNSRIVHFPEMGPEQYLATLPDGHCVGRDKKLCETEAKSFCQYMAADKYFALSSDINQQRRVEELCSSYHLVQ